jgi:hypothetical protein
MAKLAYGVGVNDLINGSNDDFYRAWIRMLERCYSDEYKRKFPTYIDCIACDDWLVFSNFKSWMGKQDWVDNRLDKDIIKKGNKIYCPEYCAFVSPTTNGFVVGDLEQKNQYLLGVSFHERAGKFRSRCRNPFTKKEEYLGLFTDESLAHAAWLMRKNELANILAAQQNDSRVSAALSCRYKVDTL